MELAISYESLGLIIFRLLIELFKRIIYLEFIKKKLYYTTLRRSLVLIYFKFIYKNV